MFGEVYYNLHNRTVFAKNVCIYVTSIFWRKFSDAAALSLEASWLFLMPEAAIKADLKFATNFLPVRNGFSDTV